MPFFAKLKQKMFNSKLKKNNAKYWAVFGVFFLVIFLFPRLAFAGVAEWTVVPLLQGVLGVVNMILTAANILFAYIVDPANMKTIMTHSVIYTTWTTVRDIFNVVFIMVLLFSAFATIFQAAASYNYKKILLNLVIMALLVNFSYPIARFIIDASNVLMFGFLSGLGLSNSFSDLVSGTGIVDIAKTKNTSIVYLLSAIIFTFILAITLLVIAVLLVIRTIALTIYIIFSPIGFVGQIAPGTGLAAAGSKWWKDFMQQCFAGPIIIFYLFVATKMFTAISSGQSVMKSFSQSSGGNNPTDFNNLTSAASFFAIPIIILWLGIIQAQQSGIAGASAVVGAGTKAMKWAGRTFSGYRAGKWVATKAAPAVTKAGMQLFEENVLAPRGLSPTAFIEGWKQRAKDNRAKAINPATGTWRDKFNKWRDGTTTNYGQLEKERIEAARMKELREISTHSGVMMSNGAKLIGSGASTASLDWRGIIKTLFSQRDQDDFMHFIREHFDDPMLAGGQSFRSIGIKEDELGVSGWNVNQATEKILKACGDKDEDIMKYILDVDEISGANKSVGYGGVIVDKQGKRVKAKNKWQQAQAAIAKLSTAGDTQAIAKETHRNYITAEGIDPKTGHTIINAEFAEMVRKGIPAIIKTQVDRHAPTFYQQVDSEETLKGMRHELDRLLNDTSYLNYWDKDADDGEGGKGAVVNKRITQEEYEQTTQWINAQEIYAKTGKKTTGTQADLDEMRGKLKNPTQEPAATTITPETAPPAPNKPYNPNKSNFYNKKNR